MKTTSLRGITLVELMISLVVIAIMMTGILSTNTALMRMNESTLSLSKLGILLMPIATDIRNHAVAATGDASDYGIRFQNPATNNNTNYFCFRNDVQATPTPITYANHTWFCYSRRQNASTSAWTDLYRCQGTAPAACTSGGVYLGQLAYNGFSASNMPIFDGTNGFRMTLVTREKPDQAQDPLTNAETTLSINVLPPNHSF